MYGLQDCEVAQEASVCFICRYMVCIDYHYMSKFKVIYFITKANNSKYQYAQREQGVANCQNYDHFHEKKKGKRKEKNFRKNLGQLKYHLLLLIVLKNIT